MKVKRLLSFVVVATAFVSYSQEKLKDKWVFVSNSLASEKAYSHVSNIVVSASSSGMNGILLSGGIERWYSWDEAKKERLVRMKKLCDEKGLEIIPLIWSVGYGSPLSANANLIEGVPLSDIPYKRVGNSAVFDCAQSNLLANAGMENVLPNRHIAGGWFTDRPEDVSFHDDKIKASGSASVRFEPKKDSTVHKHGHARISYGVKLRKNAVYKFSLKLKTEDLKENGKFMMQVYLKDHTGSIASSSPLKRKPPTQDWTEYSIFFQTGDKDYARVYAGTWGANGGKFWIDDLKLELVGYSEIVVNEYCKMKIVDADSGKVYEEGKDYVPVNTRLKKDSPKYIEIKLPSSTSIPEGAKLLVSAYVPCRVAGGQLVCCMSNPRLYEYFKKSAAAVKEALNPKKWFLSMDEIRGGGTCPMCVARKTDMAHILGDCVTKQRDIIKSVCPDADIYIWHDMFDPAFNAKDNYYMANGTFEESWNYAPKDVIMSVWGSGKYAPSLAAMAAKGFKVQAACYYDTDNLDGCKPWLESCLKIKNCTGIMYTTWRNKYELLPAFGEMLRKAEK
jgi:hypothetical protein